MEADNLGHEEGEIKIEDHLKSFLGYCNRTNASIRNSNLSPSMPATENRKEYTDDSWKISRNSKEGV